MSPIDWITQERWPDVDLEAELAGRPKRKAKATYAEVVRLVAQTKSRRLVAAIRRYGRAA